MATVYLKPIVLFENNRSQMPENATDDYVISLKDGGIGLGSVPENTLLLGNDADSLKTLAPVGIGEVKFLRQVNDEGTITTAWAQLGASQFYFVNTARLLGRTDPDGGLGQEIELGAGLAFELGKLVCTIEEPDLSGYVPFTGATSDLNLNDKNLTNINELQVDALVTLSTFAGSGIRNIGVNDSGELVELGTTALWTHDSLTNDPMDGVFYEGRVGVNVSACDESAIMNLYGNVNSNTGTWVKGIDLGVDIERTSGVGYGIAAYVNAKNVNTNGGNVFDALLKSETSGTTLALRGYNVSASIGSGTTVDSITGYRVDFGSPGAGTITTKYGIYATGEDLNYFSGYVRTGSGNSKFKIVSSTDTEHGSSINSYITIDIDGTTYHIPSIKP